MRNPLILFLLVLVMVVGCSDRPSREITLSTAQAFHSFIKDVGSDNGFECEMSGFPIWKTRGLEPSPGHTGEWHFFTPSDPDGDGEEDLSTTVLTIGLVPLGSANPKDVLFTWKAYEVVVLSQGAPSAYEGSQDSLITALKKLNKS